MRPKPISIEAPFADKYHRDGFAIVHNLLTAEALAMLRERITAVAERRVPTFPAHKLEFEPRAHAGAASIPAAREQKDSTAQEPRRIRKINGCAEHDPVFFEQVTGERIVDHVEALIGPNIKLFASQCFMKPPGGVAKPYHQDSHYFTIDPPALVTCWIALDDVTIDNGCMWCLPGSHRGELLDHSQSWDAGDRLDVQVPDAKIDSSRETPIEMSAGSCSFHHSMLLHRSGPNHTGAPRRGLAVHFMSAQSRWTNPESPAPQYRLVRGRESPGCV